VRLRTNDDDDRSFVFCIINKEKGFDQNIM